MKVMLTELLDDPDAETTMFLDEEGPPRGACIRRPPNVAWGPSRSRRELAFSSTVE
jgi:hypothetical protein